MARETLAGLNQKIQERDDRAAILEEGLKRLGVPNPSAIQNQATLDVLVPAGGVPITPPPPAPTPAPAGSPPPATPGGSTVPDISGASFNQAQSLAQTVGMTISVGEKVPSDKPLDTVARQQPVANTPAIAGSSIMVNLSDGSGAGKPKEGFDVMKFLGFKPKGK